MHDSPDNENWFVFDGHRVFYRRLGVGDPIVFLPNATLTGSCGSTKSSTSAPPTR
jgi:hypothetical protein